MSAKKGKKAVPIEEVIEAKKGQVEALRQQCYAVEKMLGISSDQMKRVQVEYNDSVRQTAITEEKIADLDHSLDEHVKFMQRLSTTNAEQLKQRYESTKNSVKDAERENEALRQKIKDMVSKKKEELRQCQEEVDREQHNIDERALHFGVLLKDRLAKVQHV
ncbi:hypothetical protein STCU_02922 [Strigomonas culicis]|uniref:Coiled-coil domain-containing protein 153 n=1 Tax=Strigomonas culicis TaxID=28005 RepID=S9VYN7_9TRYP|nr:hypothetical protein STCU_07350 [Strigomonas culicis]EPY32216.1 hypothetical protein STCU_02922 [Strigomonas culicis]|eukprot:EPY24038.1 hypothetical protein STCU_07350 [Strigomonas culicis]